MALTWLHYFVLVRATCSLEFVLSGFGDWTFNDFVPKTHNAYFDGLTCFVLVKKQ